MQEVGGTNYLRLSCVYSVANQHYIHSNRIWWAPACCQAFSILENHHWTAGKIFLALCIWWEKRGKILNLKVSHRVGEILYNIPYMQNLKKKWQKWTYLWNRLTDLENEAGRKGRKGVWNQHVHTAIFKILIDYQPGPTYFIVQEMLLNILWHLGWEGIWGENGYVNMNGWAPLLSTWNYHIWLYNQLYFNIK